MRLNNKKNIIAIILALVVIGTIVVIAVMMKKEQSPSSDTGKQTGQSQDADDKDTDTGDDGAGGLEVQDVLDENNKKPENSTSVSGTWDDEEIDANKTPDKQEPATQPDKDDTDNSNSNGADEEEDEDTVESDIVYGNIY